MLEVPQKAGGQELFSKLSHFPISRIIVGISAVLAGALVNKFALKPLFALIKLPAFLSNGARFGINALVVTVIYYFLFRVYERRTITELNPRKFLKHSASAELFGFIMISLTIVLLFVSGHYTVLSISRKPYLLLYPLLFNVFIGAIEEIISRGIFYRITEQALGTHAALVVTSMLFAGFHLMNEGADVMTLISIFFWSVFLGLLLTYSRSLWLPMFFHAGWNFAMAFWGTRVSGMNDFKPYELFHIEIKGPEIITGGAFGPENSIITLAVILVLVILFYFKAKRSGNISRPFWRKQASIISPDGRN